MSTLVSCFSRGPVLAWLWAGLLAGVWSPQVSALEVETDMEGASVRVQAVKPETQAVEFMPGGDAFRGWPCWWYFRVRGLETGRPLTLTLAASDSVTRLEGKPPGKPLAASWAMADRASYSLDGKTWHHTAPGVKLPDGRIQYQVPAPPEGQTWSSVLVAWGPPYTPSRAVEFVRQMGQQQRIAQEMELCRSREGRVVPMLRISEGDRVPERRFGVWVQARQHAWESGASWVCQGFAEWVLSDEPEAAWLRQNAEIYVVPIMDVDNVATGNGGKDAVPQDHNRDWSEKPNWNEVAAAQRIVTSLIAEGRMDLFLDLHNPAPNDRKTFFFAPATELLKDEAKPRQAAFLKLAYEKISPVMPMLTEPKITASSYHPLWRQISGNWVQSRGNPHTVALCLETAWNTEKSTVEIYRKVGENLGITVRRFLETSPR